MNLSSEVREQQTVIGLIHLAAMNGVTPADMSGMDSVVPDGAGGVLAKETADVRLAGMLIARTAMGSDVRLELVSALRARILAGTYRVAAEDVAKSLMGALLR
jgi:hypothetical protein